MVVGYYEPGTTTAQSLLEHGLAEGHYIPGAGWSHHGLIDLASRFGVQGQTRGFHTLSMDQAFQRLKDSVETGPAIASVHYRFDPQSTIPHLVVVREIKDGMVYYSDPAEKAGNGAIQAARFKKAWKKRIIATRPSTDNN